MKLVKICCFGSDLLLMECVCWPPVLWYFWSDRVSHALYFLGESFQLNCDIWNDHLMVLICTSSNRWESLFVLLFSLLSLLLLLFLYEFDFVSLCLCSISYAVDVVLPLFLSSLCFLLPFKVYLFHLLLPSDLLDILTHSQALALVFFLQLNNISMIYFGGSRLC